MPMNSRVRSQTCSLRRLTIGVGAFRLFCLACIAKKVKGEEGGGAQQLLVDAVVDRLSIVELGCLRGEVKVVQEE